MPSCAPWPRAAPRRFCARTTPSCCTRCWRAPRPSSSGSLVRAAGSRAWLSASPRKEVSHAQRALRRHHQQLRVQDAGARRLPLLPRVLAHRASSRCVASLRAVRVLMRARWTRPAHTAACSGQSGRVAAGARLFAALRVSRRAAHARARASGALQAERAKPALLRRAVWRGESRPPREMLRASC